MSITQKILTEKVIKVIKWLKREGIFNKLNQYAWGNEKVSAITTLGMRVNPSLQVFNL